MLFQRSAGPALLILLISCPAAAAAQGELSLTLQEALALARERAPAVLGARARVEEARGQLLAASVRMRGNPVLDANAGRRSAGGDDFTDVEVGVTQGLGVVGRRTARIAAAEAGVSVEAANGEETTRRLVLEAGEAFLRSLHATQRLEILRHSQDVAAEIARVAERRFQAGDIAVLDVNVARAGQARTLSEVLSAGSELRAALGELKILLGLRADESPVIRGELDRLPAYELSTLVEQAPRRPDIIALGARIEQAEAEARVAATSGRPELDVGVRYKEEEDATVVLGGLAVSLPVLDRGQGALAEARARALRLRIEHDALRQAAEMEVRTMFETYHQRLEAALALRQVIPVVSENEELAGRSYETGQIGLVELLLIRRDALEIRLLHLDRTLEAVVAGIRLEASAGVLR